MARKCYLLQLLARLPYCSGHHPEIEQADGFVNAHTAFLGSDERFPAVSAACSGRELASPPAPGGTGAHLTAAGPRAYTTPHWPDGRVVMQRTANPRTAVRFRFRPPG